MGGDTSSLLLRCGSNVQSNPAAVSPQWLQPRGVHTLLHACCTAVPTAYSSCSIRWMQCGPTLCPLMMRQSDLNINFGNKLILLACAYFHSVAGQDVSVCLVPALSYSSGTGSRGQRSPVCPHRAKTRLASAVHARHDVTVLW